MLLLVLHMSTNTQISDNSAQNSRYLLKRANTCGQLEGKQKDMVKFMTGNKFKE